MSEDWRGTWRIALVIEVDAETQEDATEVGFEIANGAAQVKVCDDVWVDSTGARLWADSLGPVN